MSGTAATKPHTPKKSQSRSARRSDDAADVPGLPARQAATRLLAAVIETRTPLDALTDQEHGHTMFLALDGRDRSLVRAILATALRFRMTIEALIAARLERPLPPNATAVRHILHVGAAQVLFLDIPDSAAVDLAVRQAHADPRARRFAGLVNAVLRELARRKERALPVALAKARDCPDWFIQRLEAAYGADGTAAILAAHRLEATTDFTVKSDPEGWALQLGGFVLPTGSVRVARLDASVAELPGYADGEWWVQDAAAALPARLFGDVSGLRVADICAAPGGKTAQLAAAGAIVTAIDVSRNRIERLKTNLERLRLPCTVVQADLFDFAPETAFDAVLLDVPCSSTGTIRRHPDVAWTKSAEDVEKLAGLQRRMLARAADLVKPGGTIVFSNCSLDPEEGERIAEAAVLGGRLVAEPLAPDLFPGLGNFITPEGWLRTTPAALPLHDPKASGLDGFFATRFNRLV